MLAFAGVALAALALLWWPRAKPASQLAGVEVSYRQGAVASLDPATRTLNLEKGAVEVKGHAPLSIRAAGYLVRLTEAHAVFAADSIRVLSGEVLVFTLDERPLATLTAGQGWPPPTAPVAAAPVAPAIGPPAAPRPSAASELERARSALADGDAVLARRLIRRALAAASSAHDRAEAELFTAESYLVERDASRALAQYRRVANRFPRLPEGEAAAFAAAQVLSESGPRDDANAAFSAYLLRYPEGRFAPEARDRLKE